MVERMNLIYGKHVVDEFLRKHPNMVKRIWAKEPKVVREWASVKELEIPVSTLGLKEVVEFFDNPINHQGIVAEIKEYNYQPFGQIRYNLEQRAKDLVLVLDQVHDPYNFGAIIRSASLLGVKNIIILDHKQVQVNPTVVKVSSGTVYDLAITKVSNLNNVVRELKKLGYWIYTSNLSQEAQPLDQINFSDKVVVIVGNEENGVSDLLTKNSDHNLYIPTTEKIDSFNVSVATAIILYEVAKKISLF